MRDYSKGIRLGWAVACVLIGALRLYGITDDLFKTIAHLVVGGMLSAWAVLLATEQAYGVLLRTHGVRLYPGFYGYAGLGISLVEGYMALAGRGDILRP